MKTVLKFTVAMFLFIGCVTYVSAQGFVNLNFELAGLFIAPTSPGSYGGQVDPALAFPGWTIRNTRFTNFGTYILYNNLTVDSAMVGLIGPSYPNALNLTSLHGSYSALLQEASIGSYFGRPTLSQIGTVPANAHSISFLGVIYNGAVSMDGTQLALIDVGNGRWAADVTAYAGKRIELLFETLQAGDETPRRFYVDDILFSANSVPEPSAYALGVLAVLAFTCLRKRLGSR